MDKLNNIEQYTIEKKTSAESALTFENLRSLGIKLTQDFSAETWTDYNLHDPGVTILENICYAITDLAYRTKFKIEDILADNDGTVDSKKNYFISPRDILATNPVSVNDFRKLLIDTFPEIENVWLEPNVPAIPVDHCRGLFRVLIQYRYSLMNNSKQEFEKLISSGKKKINKFISGCRNLGDLCNEIVFLEPLEVDIKANILVKDNQFAEDLLADINVAVYRFLNPPVKFYAALDMKQMGYSSAEMNQGPFLKNGFLQDSVLNSRQTQIDPTDIAKVIAAIPGVLRVRDFSFIINGTEYERETFVLDKNQKDCFLFFNYENETRKINLFQDDFKIPVKNQTLINKTKIKLDHATTAIKSKTSIGGIGQEDGARPVSGNYRNTKQYHSIQHLFPGIYKLKLRIDELENSRGNNNLAEIAAINQLKAYLMFFEQVMANYLAQLSNISNIFSCTMDEGKMQTYFFQPVYNIPGVERILNDFNSKTSDWESFKKDTDNEYISFLRQKIESDTSFLNRKHRVLDHALARFNIDLNIYPLKLYSELYDKYKVEGRKTKLLLWKKFLLENIVTLLRNRNQAYDFYQQPDEMMICGFQHLMQALLYIGLDNVSGTINRAQKKLCPVFNAGTGPEFSTGGDKAMKLPQLDGPLVFKKMNIAFFCNGLNPDNYQIVSVDNGQIQLLKFRNSNEHEEHDIGKFSSYFSAIAARNKVIEYLRKINIESEGFHLVEHNLLLPPYNEPISSFGFKVVNRHGHILCRHNECSLYGQRNEIIKKILEAAKKGSSAFTEFMKKEGGHYCKFPLELKNDPAHYYNYSSIQHHYRDDEKKQLSVLEELRVCLVEIAEKTQSGSRIVSLVKYGNDALVEEDFFSFRLSVVLPSWPARFQDDKFRHYLEKTFIENTPAHIRLFFVWLDFSKMEQFETIYFNWLTEINKSRLSLPALESSNSLISWLSKINPGTSK